MAPIRNLDAATLRRLAVLADCDPRSIQKVLRGDKVRGMAGQRIRRVLLEQGMLAEVPFDAAGGMHLQ